MIYYFFLSLKIEMLVQNPGFSPHKMYLVHVFGPHKMYLVHFLVSN